MDLAVAGRPRACALDTLTRCAAVAQWIEHLPPKERVAGSIPASRTSLPVYRHLPVPTPSVGYKFPRGGSRNDLTAEWADGSFHQAGILCAWRTSRRP